MRRDQVLINVDNQSVVGAFNRGRAKDRETHALLVQLFDLQVDYGFMLSLKWVPTADNGVADAISKPSRDSKIRLTAEAFRALWDDLGPFNMDLMASTASAQRVPGNAGTLPFFSRNSIAKARPGRTFCPNMSPEFQARENLPLGIASHHRGWPGIHCSIWQSATRTR